MTGGAAKAIRCQGIHFPTVFWSMNSRLTIRCRINHAFDQCLIISQFISISPQTNQSKSSGWSGQSSCIQISRSSDNLPLPEDFPAKSDYQKSGKWRGLVPAKHPIRNPEVGFLIIWTNEKDWFRSFDSHLHLLAGHKLHRSAHRWAEGNPNLHSTGNNHVKGNLFY